ncbi:BnaC08g40930D [Brassica napus]|uniref:BnaC08g40930D protein n=1 Tax=Brassica napus TaxID=3708 RepID=A0A078FNP1_BRANA|nr:BnaC08g40930D [Brassica napus]
MMFGITFISTIRSTNSTAWETLPTRHKPLIKVENAKPSLRLLQKQLMTILRV